VTQIVSDILIRLKEKKICLLRRPAQVQFGSVLAW